MKPLIAVADDLTGAAEIAAVGQAHGLRALVARRADSLDQPGEVDLVVLDTDSRLESAEMASARLTALADRSAITRDSRWFKKVDSVLRGAVADECLTLARILGRRRVLLVPANPHLGRTVEGGLYRIEGVPLHLTPFARDPHHPATTDRVLDLLQREARQPVTSAARPADAARDGLVIGDATRAADLDAWATVIDSTSLPAGGAAFFAAWLRQQGLHAATSPTLPPPPMGPTLIVLGSIAEASHRWRAAAEARGLAVVPLRLAEPLEVMPWDALRAHLTRQPALALVVDATGVDPTQVGRLASARLAAVVAALHADAAFRHLVVAGGSTAACVLEALDWTALDLLGEWAPGVVSLRPRTTSPLTLTLKPGSYGWPDSLTSSFFRA
jgi:uncharacterized protein YgbK (DUF1537 family)